MINNELHENDLDIILNDVADLSTQFDKDVIENTKNIVIELTQDELKNNSNIISLDDDKNDSEMNLETPESLLNEYSNYDLELEKLNIKIEEVKMRFPDVFKMLDEIESSKNEVLEKQSEIKNKIKDSMIQYDKKSISNDFWKVTYVASYTKTTFDRSSFEKKYPVLAKQFIKESTVSDSTRWTQIK